MQLKKFIILDFGLLAALGLLNFLAFKYYLYWRFWWLDMPAHFLGGWALGLAGVLTWFLIRYRRAGAILTKTGAFLASFLPVLIIGCLWELFELNADRFYFIRAGVKTLNHLEANWGNSVSDLFFDFVGAGAGLLSLVLFWPWVKKEEQN